MTFSGQHQQLSKAYAICVFAPLIDLSETVGYTQFWPGSHKYQGLLGFGPAAEEIGTSSSIVPVEASRFIHATIRSYYKLHADMYFVDVSLFFVIQKYL